MLNPEHKTFIVQIVSLSSIGSLSSIPYNTDIYPSCRSQISNLIAEEAPTNVLAKYANFAHIFSLDLASKLFSYTKINNYVIKFVTGQQTSYEPIYHLRLVELKILKAYIETNLANKFIRPFKSLVGTPILFDQKSNRSFWLCANDKISITSQSRTSTNYRLLESYWIG